MNRRRSYVRTGIALLLLAACAAAALFVPEGVSGWYEKQSLGQIAYENISYEPYEIRYYDSFEEKLDAIAANSSYGYELNTLQVIERNKNVEDKELIDIVNEELADMYKAGLFPEETKVISISDRRFYEAYTIVDMTDEARGMDQARGMDPLRNVYFWMLDCVTERGSITVRLDSEYHKIYTFTLYEEPGSGSQLAWTKWREPYVAGDAEPIIQGWAAYWELQSLQENAVYENGAGSNKGGAIASDGAWYGDGFLSFPVILRSGNYLDMSVHVYGYYGNGWGVHVGLGAL